MDIIIPICGKGERFLKAGYNKLKPMIPVCGKPIIYYLLDNLFYNYELEKDDKVYLIIGKELENYTIEIKERYNNICFLNITTPTRGAAETVFMGIQKMTSDYLRPLLLLDGDTFYKTDIVNEFRKKRKSCLATFEVDKLEPPHYSYTKINEKKEIIEIAEKNPISNIANTGAYYFENRKIFTDVCQNILSFPNKMTRGEFYTSVVVSELIKNGETFEIINIDKNSIVSLGTPNDVKLFEQSTLCYLFDLDGTLVTTDHLYLNVWKKIIEEYDLHLTEEMFVQHIQGKNDSYAMKSLMLPASSYEELSKKKDDGMAESMDNIILHKGVYSYLKQLRSCGYLVGIVTNSNKRTASEIIRKYDFKHDLLITANDVKNPKPNAEPFRKAMDYFNISNDRTVIFEDSKSGIISARAVSPLCIVGVLGTQKEDELYKQGCNIVILNDEFEESKSLNDKILLQDKNTNKINILRDHIWKSLEKMYEFQDIIINTTKLKGGYIADVLKIKIVLKNDNIMDCILKLESTNENMLSQVATKLDLYNREYLFYQSVAQYAPINVPKFIGLIRDEKTLKIIGILLECIDTEQYDINIDLNKQPIESIMKIIDKCAQFHAWSWNKDIKKEFSFIKLHNDSMFFPEWNYFINEKWEIFKTKWRHVLKDSQITIGKKICDSFDKIQNLMSEGDLCICHGDIKSPNIFIDKKTKDPIFLDWQYLNCGKGVSDIVFLMIESLDNENRNKNWDVLINYYYIKLLEYGVKNYTIKNFKKDIITSLCHFPFFVAMWFGTVETEELIDNNFPFMFIMRYFSLIETYNDELNEFLEKIQTVEEM